MNRKKTVYIGVLILLAILAVLVMGSKRQKPEYDAGNDRKQNTGHDKEYRTEDYPERYKNQLQIIFGENYIIGEKETIIVEEEDCDCGYHTDGYEYDQWNISYQDQDGQNFTQILNNRMSLESQQLSWLNNHLRQYYTQKYLIDFFEDGTFERVSTGEDLGRTYCSVRIGSTVGGYTSDEKEEYDRIQKAGREYKEQLLRQLQDEEKMLHLSEVDYEDIFNCFPVKIGFHLSLDDGELTGTEKEEFEKAVEKRVLEMIQSLKQETNDTCNLRIQVCSANGHCDLYDGARDWRYFILQGERIYPEDLFDGFEWQLFYTYEGIYW